MENPRYEELRDIARQLGLDFFDVIFEVVPQDIMSEVAAYGLPTRARHWSYGKVYNRQRVHGQMGLSKIYEIVLNNDPAMPFCSTPIPRSPICSSSPTSMPTSTSSNITSTSPPRTAIW